MSANGINLMLKAPEHTKCWWLVWSLCSHSCPCLLFPVLNWQLDQDPHKDVSLKNIFLPDLWLKILLVIWCCLSEDNSELCRLLWVSCLAWGLDLASNHGSTWVAQGRCGLGNGWQRFAEECWDDVWTSDSDKSGSRSVRQSSLK